MADLELLASGKMEVAKEHRLAPNAIWPCYVVKVGGECVNDCKS